MRRREFITLLGGAAASPSPRSAQQGDAVIGFLGSASSETGNQPASRVPSGPGRTGYIEGRNVAIEYRWADGQYERMPSPGEEFGASQPVRDRGERPQAAA